MRILVTGTAGFIGSSFVRMLLGKPCSAAKGHPTIGPEDKIISFDSLTYAGCRENLDPIRGDSRHEFIVGDICDRNAVETAVRIHKIDSIINFAAESHVDRSIEGSEVFVRTNVLGTLNLLEVARAHNLKFVQVSTDEVYGELGDTGSFSEESPLAPNSPYSASKTGGDCLVRAYVHTHNLHAVITRCSNNIGPYHFPEKFLPLMITRLLGGGKIPVYGTGKNVRDWLFVDDHAEGVWLAFTKGKKGAVYNFGGFGETTNLELVERVVKYFGKTSAEAIEFVTDRKGHDWRYSMDSRKAQQELGWKPRWTLEEAIPYIVDWYKQNEVWWRPKLK